MGITADTLKSPFVMVIATSTLHPALLTDPYIELSAIVIPFAHFGWGERIFTKSVASNSKSLSRLSDFILQTQMGIAIQSFVTVKTVGDLLELDAAGDRRSDLVDGTLVEKPTLCQWDDNP
jgi:hypothetical protein